MKYLYVITLLSIIAVINLQAVGNDQQIIDILKRSAPGTINVDAPVDHYKRTYLHNACGKRACIELAKELIRHGANVNAQNDINDETPLHEAACCGHYDIVKILLQSGADTEKRTCQGKTPADLAREKGHDNVAELIDSWESASDIKEPERD